MCVLRRAWSALWGRPSVGSIIGSLLAASSLVAPWVPVFRVVGRVQRHGHMGDVGGVGVQFFSGIQLIRYAFGGTLPGHPQADLSLVIIVDQVYPSAWLAALPGLLALLSLLLGALLLVTKRPQPLVILLLAVAAAAMLALALDAFVALSSLSTNAPFDTPSSVALTLAAYGLMALAYVGVLLGTARAPNTGLH